MCRCIACNTVLEPNEIIWDEERGEHEDMCKVCKDVVLDTLVTQEYLFEDLTNDFEE